MSVHTRRFAKVLVAGAAVAGTKVLLRDRMLRWGATEEELDRPLPGDELVPHPSLTANRAITVLAPPEAIWPWLVQLGQGRGGFYSYDALENLVGLGIHSADTIVPEWQTLEVDDRVHLAEQVGLRVARVERDHALVLEGAVPMGAAPMPYDFSWAFVLVPDSDGTTRLVVRERYGYRHAWVALLVEPVSAISWLMSRRMLHGIKERAERHPPPEPSLVLAGS
jgi:hypothetical protein